MNSMVQSPAVCDYDGGPHLRAMFEGAAIGIGICQLDGTILEANPALSGMLGYSREELTGPYSHALFSEPFSDAGHELDSQTASPDQRMLGTLTRGERGSFASEKRYWRKDGSELWGHLTVSLARSARREPALLIAMLADATEQKRVEEHLREAEKMEVLGRLAGGIAHDFNNLLTGILLYCDLLNAGLGSSGLRPNELLRHVDEIRTAGEQGAALTQQLLAIARNQASAPRPMLINEIVASMENLLRRLIGERIQLITRLDSQAGPVLADPAQLRQIVLNLVLNARDAMPEGGKIRIITRTAEFPGEPEPGRWVSLAVEDDGCGMDAETRARLFEPFFTTKKPGQGTGLGLATVERIVRDAGGKIQVESAVGSSTCIAVFLSALESLSEASAPFRGAGQPACETAAGTILLVDDHATARKSMERVLLDTGYRILPAVSGRQALRVFAEHAAAVDLLIAECMMPEMNGLELAELLRRQKPDLKVLLVSGRHNPPAESTASAAGLIRKPFSGKALVDRVVEVMRST
jgi:PAS domain S-box-containing protein